MELRKTDCKTFVRQNHFMYRTVDIWNSLPECVASASSLNGCKNRYNKQCIALKFSRTLLSFTLNISQQACDLHTTEEGDEKEEDDIIHFHYHNSESGVAQLNKTVDLVKSKPVVVVGSRCSKPITIFRPVLLERHWTSSDLSLHQDPSVDSQQRHVDSRVDAQSSSGRLLVCCCEICTVMLTVPALPPVCLFVNCGLSGQWNGLHSSCHEDRWEYLEIAASPAGSMHSVKLHKDLCQDLCRFVNDLSCQIRSKAYNVVYRRHKDWD